MFSPIGFYRQPVNFNGRRVGRRKSFVIVPIVLPVCPPLYLMLILWVLGVNIRYVICLFVVMSAVTGRTHIDWRYRTLKARRNSTMRCKSRISVAQFQSDQSVYVQTQMCLLLMNQYLQFRFKVIKVGCGVRGALQGG